MSSTAKSVAPKTITPTRTENMLQTVMYIGGPMSKEDIHGHLLWLIDDRVSSLTLHDGDPIDVYSESGEYMDAVECTVEARILTSFSEYSPAFAINTRYVNQMNQWVKERDGLLRWKNPFDNIIHTGLSGLSEMTSDGHLHQNYIDATIYGQI